VLAYTGMRRGEALVLRWREIDLEAAAVRIQRSAGMVRVAGESAGVVEGDTKSGKPRLVDLDEGTVAVLRTASGSAVPATRLVRRAGRGCVMTTWTPQASVRHHGSYAEGITVLSPARELCPRTDTHLNYMIDIALTTEFSLAAGAAR
jgi:integrase